MARKRKEHPRAEDRIATRLERDDGHPGVRPTAVAVGAGRLVTVGPEDEIWRAPSAQAASFPGVVAARVVPPASASDEDVETVARSFRAAGVPVRVAPRPKAEEVPADAKEAPRAVLSARAAVLELAEEANLEGDEREALRRYLEGRLDEVGL